MFEKRGKCVLINDYVNCYVCRYTVSMVDGCSASTSTDRGKRSTSATLPGINHTWTDVVSNTGLLQRGKMIVSGI